MTQLNTLCIQYDKLGNVFNIEITPTDADYLDDYAVYSNKNTISSWYLEKEMINGFVLRDKISDKIVYRYRLINVSINDLLNFINQ